MLKQDSGALALLARTSFAADPQNFREAVETAWLKTIDEILALNGEHNLSATSRAGPGRIMLSLPGREVRNYSLEWAQIDGQFRPSISSLNQLGVAARASGIEFDPVDNRFVGGIDDAPGAQTGARKSAVVAVIEDFLHHSRR